MAYFIFQRHVNMSYCRLTSVCHFLRHYNWINIIYSFHAMESIEQKAKLIDERIEQLKSLIHTTGINQKSVFSFLLWESFLLCRAI